MEKKPLKKMSIDEFKEAKGIIPAEIESMLREFNGGSFMKCHTAIYEATGIWIPELVPVFEKLDAALVTRDLPSEVRY